MRGAFAVVVLLVLGAVAWWLLQVGSTTDAPPPSAIAADDPELPEPPTERTPVAREAADVARPPPQPAAVPTDEPPAPAAAPPPAPARLVLEVFEAGSRMPVRAFGWRFSQHGVHHHGEVEGHHAELPMTGLHSGELLVEADGMQPHRQRLTLPAAGTRAERVEVFLTAVAKAEGIALWVRDLDRAPIPNVRVDAFRLDERSRDGDWHLGAPMWARRTASQNGHYVLPPLPAGDYGIVLVATDADGLLLPLRPFRRVFELTGSNGYIEDVTLEPGCALTLDLVEPDGRPLDAAGRGTVALSLQEPGTAGVRRKWTTQDQDGGMVSAADILPGAAPVWLAEPVSGGSYELQVLVDGVLRISQVLTLPNGERHTARIIVP